MNGQLHIPIKVGVKGFGRVRRRAQTWAPRNRPESLRGARLRRFERPKAIQDRSKRDFRVAWSPEIARRGLRGAICSIFNRFGLSGRAILVFFDALSIEQADSLEEAASYEKPTKTYDFYRFFEYSLLRARFVNQAKIAPKTHLQRVARHSAFEMYSVRALQPQNGVRGLAGATFEVFWSDSGGLLGGRGSTHPCSTHPVLNSSLLN